LLKEQLLHYIFELHEPRLAVFARLAVVKAVSLTRDFQEKMKHAQYCFVRQFIMRHRLVHQIGMHISQRDPRGLRRIHVDGFLCGYWHSQR
jgi:hypothetical protein